MEQTISIYIIKKKLQKLESTINVLDKGWWMLYNEDIESARISCDDGYNNTNMISDTFHTLFLKF